MKPMDMQALLPRSTDVARSRQVEIHRPAAAQQHGAQEMHRRSAQRHRAVVEADPVRGGRVSRDGKKGSGGEAGGRRSAREDSAAGPGAPAPGPGPQATKGRLVDVVLGLGQEGE